MINIRIKLLDRLYLKKYNQVLKLKIYSHDMVWYYMIWYILYVKNIFSLIIIIAISLKYESITIINLTCTKNI